MLSIGAVIQEQGCLLKTQKFIDILHSLAESPKKHAVALRHPVEGGEYIETSYLQFYNAVINTAAKLGDSLDEGTVTVGYVSNSHASYAMNLFALMLLDITPVMLSPRNTVDTQIHLLESAGATALVYEPMYEGMAKECLDKLSNLVLRETILLEPSLYATPSSRPEPLNTSGSDIHEKIVLIMHSSGTTDAPKLISISNRYTQSTIQRYRMNRTFCQKLRGTMLAVSPLFHLFGLVNFIWFLSNWDTVVFPTSLSPNRILDISERTKVTLILLLPYQIKQLAEYCHSFPERWEILKSMNALHFGGAPLPSELGRVLLNQGVMLLNGYGTTETGFLAGGLSGPSNPECRKLTLAKGLKYQLCNGYKDTAQIRILADDQNLASGLCHKKEGYLLADRLRILGKDGFGLHLEVLGRVDDTLVHPSGEKTYPVPMESSLLDSPLIHRCVILNNRKIHNCLLIQLNKEQFLRHPPLHAIQEIHLAIDKANANAPIYSRIDHSLVYILPLATDKELPVTVKGNIARSKAEEMFQNELTKLDSDFTRAPSEGPVSDLEYQSVLIQIKSLLLNMSIDPESDFFEKGLDSLSAVKLKNQLCAIYPSANITANTLYDNTTAPDLAKYICHPPQPYSNLTLAQKEVNALIEANTKFPKPTKAIKTKHPTKLDVLVTGANGSLGNFILKDLLKQPWVDHVYAFARANSPEEAASRIQTGLQSRGITLTEDEWSRVKAFPFEPNTPLL
ncbi:hypothetical protein DSO57_1034984 [Entomophthora muscae]|uniref:Uncharacterized protein n=1 Tax=Entomophthora muscae TaxID=34485 RepID=A0ACC2REH4_9FUNG|nr:hypothetical protein DSO57_1034984 [Entomophthora muscae]